MTLDPNLTLSSPKSVFTKPLTADFKALLKALSKGIGHTAVGKWEELGNDAVEALSSLGLATEPEELGFLLVRRSLTKALFDLIGESASEPLATTKFDEDSLLEQLDFSTLVSGLQLDSRFLDRPADLSVVYEVGKLLKQWLVLHNIGEPNAEAIASRLSSYFVYSLNDEWRRNAKSYRPLLDALDTPFVRAGEREWAWSAYASLLQKRIEEGIFDEPFSLNQLFVPLNAYYVEDGADECPPDELARGEKPRRRVVVNLEKELEHWLAKGVRDDAIRVISGGPGSGKSSVCV